MLQKVFNMTDNKIFKIIAIIGLILYTTQAEALEVRDFTFSHIGKTEGLNNQRIFSVRQTASGAVWWSSMTGVGRYNGATVRNYQLDEGKPFGHMGGRVIRLSTDSAAVYAFDNRGTIYLFNPYKDRFLTMCRLTEMFGHEVALNDLYVSEQGLYLAMHDGVYLLQDTTLTQMVRGVYVNCIVRMKNTLLFCAREGVFNEKGQQLMAYNIESGYYDDLYDKLWLGTYENGLHIVPFEQDGRMAAGRFVELRDDDTQNTPIRSICPYDDDTMLIGVDGMGVCQMRRDGQGECLLLFDANTMEHGVLHGNGVYSIAVDSWENIIIGTYSGGIDIARPIGSTTAIYRHVANDSQSLSNDHVNMVMPLTDDLVLMGTDNGISLLDTKTGHWQHSCQGMVVLNAGKKRDGSVLVSTYGKGVYEMDVHGTVRQVYTTSNSLLTDDHVYATLYDKDGGLWVGSLMGDLLYMPAEHQAPKYYPIHNVQAMAQLASGQIAIGTAFGLKLITPGYDEIKELNYAPSGVTDVNPFVNHLLTSGLELWIATDGGGIYVYHQAKHESRQITTKNGLPSNYVRSLVKGKDGRIWIATDEGLSFIAPDEREKIVNVNYCYGLNREYSRGAAQNLPDGDIIFGTTTGTVVIHPENVQSINYAAKLGFLGISCDVDQESLQDKDVFDDLEKGKLHLSYSQRTFDLLFESVNMRNHFDIAYRYKVGQGKWSQPTGQQYIRFVNVEPGKHQLTIQCISRTSGTVMDSKTLTITIDQPWWNTWWMWCIYIAFIVLAFYGAWRVYELHEKYMRLTIDNLKVSPTPSEEADEQSPNPQHLTPDTQQPTSNAQQPTTSTQQPAPNNQHSGEASKEFVDKATQLILARLSDTDFGIDQLCREMAMSRTLFYVKLKSYTGKSPQDFIRIIRLERAAYLLRNGHSVADAAALAGFDNPKYFSTVFKKYFDVSPSKYQ